MKKQKKGIKYKHNLQKVLLTIFLMLFVLGFILFRYLKHPVNDNQIVSNVSMTKADTEKTINSDSKSGDTEQRKAQNKQSETWKIDVKGAVKNPGIYIVDSSMRVIDAVEAAGGYIAESDQNKINNAEKVMDQMVIYVPKKGEETDLNIPMSNTATSGNVGSNNGTAQVNLNTATLAELMTLKGVGQKKAEAILQYRDENGRFEQIEDLKKVKGIGEKTFESLSQSIRI
ncbi:helix-hairpin-helix domain-containing protein [Vagococcus vulneris]|uniref:Helix-hairpin-helix DNA-binding motif class 1 domain-containing protein n=1 Tax=Vagococcus vulneris TaxID=1977869 RepID=A0A430A184_9ENTE|nr:helix-hairpin-helix domain-containing protein [Vagococcus vulneris]RSU00143.1 hypothetical protein CBF37_02255 [Vagococcus vulneris]